MKWRLTTKCFIAHFTVGAHVVVVTVVDVADDDSVTVVVAFATIAVTVVITPVIAVICI